MTKRRILIVDDEKNILTTLKDAFELEEYDVSVAGSGEIALEKISEKRPDCILLDLALPGMSGHDLLRKMQEMDFKMPVIMMSGQGSINDAIEAVRLGALDFIEKPLSAEKALITVDNALKITSLSESNRTLRDTLEEKYKIIGNSSVVNNLLKKIDNVAPSKGRVLITGESGTGKELVARRLHNMSDRSSTAFVKVNCAAIPSELIESELFGHKKGSFTGAIADRQGKFKNADHGTLFLDEIGDMKLEMQAKLLRVLQESEFEPIGSDRTVTVDVRVIAATNKDLESIVRKGDFREDLFYRLNVIPLRVPPLRERIEDIPLLAEYFTRQASEENNRKIKSFSDDAIAVLKKLKWRGNIRQLKNFCEQVVILIEKDQIDVADINQIIQESQAPSAMDMSTIRDGSSLREIVEDFEKKVVLHFLQKNDGNMTATATALQLERSHLYKKCKILGIKY